MSLSLDLDNKWSYLKTHGNEAWQEFPSYLDVAVPRILAFLKSRELTITFFIVGQDAALQKNREALAQIADAGHEIASHSFNHEPWLHLYNRRQLNEELQRAEEAIEYATGYRVRGFRGPGFSLSRETLEVLHERGYEYDATAFPNILNPLARAYFFANSDLSDEEKVQRKALFGTFGDAFRPVKPYQWQLDVGEMLELPVTTMPIFKTPMHFSYLIYLASFNRIVAKAYLKFACSLCVMTKTEPSLLLHPLDFLGIEDDTGLDFFPAMKMPIQRKLELMDEFFSTLLRRFEPFAVGAYLDDFGDSRSLKRYRPEFSH